MSDSINPGIASKLISAFEQQKVSSHTSTSSPSSRIHIAGKEKNVLIVFAHQDRRSFNGALLERSTEVLEALGHTVTVSDLYAMEFEPRALPADIQDYDIDASQRSFKYHLEILGGCQRGTLAADITDEQQKVAAADIIIFQFPLYWWSFPAILKGWLERVMGNGFAYEYNPETPGEIKPILQGKRVLLSITTGMPLSEAYSNRGISGDIDAILCPLQFPFNYCGMDVVPPAIFYGPASCSHDRRTEMLQEWGERLVHVFRQDTVRFLPKDCFTDDQQVPLDSLDEVAGLEEVAPNPYQHFGRPIRPGSMRTGCYQWMGKEDKSKRKKRDNWVRVQRGEEEQFEQNGGLFSQY